MNYDPKNFNFYNIKSEPFRIYGLYNPQQGNEFLRMPRQVAEKVSEGVKNINNNTAGGRVRFTTNAKEFVIRASVHSVGDCPILALTNSCGFDVYEEINGKDYYVTTARPEGVRKNEKLDNLIVLRNSSEKQITVNFPLYGPVTKVEIGLPSGATLTKHRDYKIEKPVVFYGSSITQGAAAVRPGVSYQAFVSRNLDCNYINLGFSGNAKAEDEMINYLASLEMSAFVQDYDHNAPNLEHLNATHLKLYKKIRDTHKAIPIILTSKPDINLFDREQVLRRITVQKTYHYAVEHGDKKVYYIDGYSLFEGKDREDCTADGCHPNDLGFYRMANAMTNALNYALYWDES